jgi:hypothetical protein
MTLDKYVIAALASTVVGAVLIVCGGRWLWRLAGAALVALGLTMLFLLVRGAGGLLLM